MTTPTQRLARLIDECWYTLVPITHPDRSLHISGQAVQPIDLADIIMEEGFRKNGNMDNPDVKVSRDEREEIVEPIRQAPSYPILGRLPGRRRTEAEANEPSPESTILAENILAAGFTDESGKSRPETAGLPVIIANKVPANNGSLEAPIAPASTPAAAVVIDPVAVDVFSLSPYLMRAHHWMWFCLAAFTAGWAILAGAVFINGGGLDPSVVLFGLVGNIILAVVLWRFDHHPVPDKGNNLDLAGTTG